MTEVKLNGSIDLRIPVKKVNPVRKQVKKEPRVSMPRVRSVDEIKQSVTTALEKVGGKYVHFDDINHTEGLLVAGVIDSIDGDVSADNICFAVVDRDRNVQYVNNNEHFAVLRGDKQGVAKSIRSWAQVSGALDEFGRIDGRKLTLEQQRSVVEAMEYFNMYEKDGSLFVKTEDSQALNKIGISNNGASDFALQ